MTTIETDAPATSSRPRAVALLGALGVPVLFVAIWTSGYLVGELGTRVASPFTLLFWRFAVAAVVMTTVALVTRAPWPRTPAAWGQLLVTGALLQAMQFGGVYLALAAGVSAGLTSLLISASPLILAVAGIGLFGERLRPAQWLGLALGLAGVGVAVLAEISGTQPLSGVLLVLLGLAGFTAGTLWQKRTGIRMDLRSGSAVQLLGATAVATPLTALHGGFALPATATAIGSVLWLATINSIGGFVLLFVLLRRRTGGSATSYLFLVPPVTALLAVPVLGEPLAVGALLGIALAAVGVALVTRTPAASR